ncbi:single-stranded-DNA-specific exonuclease RecJ [Patescibacteria group bacterium]|nr:single-stranded-DNA-specific exonuclease RecJ [Patescibacteria group bacterium]
MKWSLKTKKTPKNSEELKKILFDNRKIEGSLESFFNPTNPMEITLKEVNLDEKQLKLIIKRIRQAKKKKEYIVIFGDYDADGVCASAILWQTLFDMGCNVKPFIPHRKEHGYGVSVKAIDVIIASKKPDLIITVDNGIVAHESVQYLKSLGVDVIVTDHHQPEVEKGKFIFPKADFIFYSTKLCGATVAWMLARELIRVENEKAGSSQVVDKNLPKTFLDLCGIATIADQVQLFGANRSFAKYGIEAVKKTKRIGLRLLLEKTVRDLEGINSDTIGFVIGPRINAMGRMADGIIALRFLCTKNRAQAEKLLHVLIETNEQRKSLTYELVAHAEKQIEFIKDEHILIVYSDHYNEGILGLIAGAILERHSKPAIAISMGEDFAKASARSVPGVNIVEFLREIRDDLLEVGGHPLAAGFGFEPSKLEVIKSRLFELAREEISKDLLIKQIESECVLPFELAGDETVEIINSFEPFGQGNSGPMFEMRDVEVSEIASMGKEGAHLRVMLGGSNSKNSKDGSSIKAIGWRMGKLSEELNPGDKINIVGSLEFNFWNGRRSLQIILKDVVVCKIT